MYCCEEVRKHFEEFGQWRGGSHYHCGACNEVTGAYGHWHQVHWIDGKAQRLPEGHFSCSKECDLNK